MNIRNCACKVPNILWFENKEYLINGNLKITCPKQNFSKIFVFEVKCFLLKKKKRPVLHRFNSSGRGRIALKC